MENIIFLIISFFAASAATIAGFGSSTLLIPVAISFMDIKTAVFIVACFHLFNNFFKVSAFRNKIDLRLFIIFGIPSIIFAFIGATLITKLPIGTIKNVLATFLIVFSIYSLVKPKFQINDSTINGVLGGGFSGFLAGLIGMGGAIRGMFLIVFNLPKEVYVGTSAMIALFIDLTRIPTYLLTDAVQDMNYLKLLPFLLVTAYLGVKTGKLLLNKINQEVFRKIVIVALFLVGIKILFF